MDRRRLGLLIGAGAAAYLLFLVAPLILLAALLGGGLGLDAGTCDGPGGTARAGGGVAGRLTGLSLIHI